jgi:hypothetical protein
LYGNVQQRCGPAICRVIEDSLMICVRGALSRHTFKADKE